MKIAAGHSISGVYCYIEIESKLLDIVGTSIVLQDFQKNQCVCMQKDQPPFVKQMP